VLTVAKIAGSGAAAYGQYLEGRTVAAEAGDYYLAADGERVEAPGRWVLGQRGGETLGVDAGRPVAAEQFQALMAVQNPATGERLRAGGAGGTSVAAIDATFSAPKSVSAVWALASPQLRAGIEAAQERAVDAALAHATEFVPMVRRRVDRETVLRETPAELLATSWRHTTARAVAGRAPDPQLHSHVVLHGAVRAGDGKVVAIESRAWLVHQREVGAAYRAQLAAELGELGFGIETGTGRGGRYFELAGVPPGLVEQWSGRHRQVRAAIDQRLLERAAELQEQVDAGGSGADAAAGRLAALERSGQLLPSEQRAVAMTTRAAKGDGGLQTAGDLDQAWYEAAREHDFNARSVEALLHESGRAVDVAEPEPAREEMLGRRILERLTEFDATFAPREARAVALEAVAGGDPAAGLAALEQLRERSEILELVDGRETTRAHRGTERAAVTAARALADTPTEAIDPELVDADVSKLQSALALGGMQLAAEQEQAMRVACSDRRLTVIVGQAGTGKSTALTGVARAHQAAGRQVVVCSTGAQAAERLTAELAQEGVNAAGYSTAALQAAVARGAVQLGPDTTVIHDEAALASTREQAWLLQTAAAGGARVIEVGDPRQSHAVGAGGLWPAIETAASERGGLVELSRIVRAKDAADRRDQARWRAGEHDQALAGYAVRGRVVVESTQRQAEDRALEAAHADRREGHSALVVVQTSNEQLDGLNARAQALRVQDGELGGQAVALAGRPYGLYAGDEIVLRAASTHPQLGAVRNGTRGMVLDVADDEQTATVQLTDGRQAGFDRGQLDAASARLGYVSHTWPAQGQTVDRAHVIAGEHSDANGTYVALTRARESTRLYASAQRLDAGDQDGGREDRLARLADRLGRSEPEVPSIAVPLAHEQRVERELDEQSAPSPPRRPDRRPDNDDVSRRQGSERERREQQHARLDQARVERDHASAELERARVQRDRSARVIATLPRDPQIQHALADAQDAAGQAQYAAAQAGQLTDQLGDLGRFARLGERGRALKAQLAETRDWEQRAAERQQRLEQDAESRQARLAEQRQVWDAQHPGAPQRHQSAQRAYEHARDRHHTAEQTYDMLLTQSLVNATAVPSPGAQRPLRPGDALELDRPARRPGPERGREGPSFGF